MNREELQQDFHNEQGINWLNSQEEPDIDYVMWLENKILAIKNNTPLPPAEGAEQRIRVRNILQDFYRRGEYELEQAEEDIMRLFQPQPTADGAEASRQIRQLKEFHTAFKLPQRDMPTIIPPDEFKLRHKILVEEVGELSDAYFVGDIVEVADAITDCLYVLIGTALQFGIADKLEAFFDEVHRSNMSKLGNDGYPIMREDGKVMKGENYTRPDLKRILSESIAAQPQPTAEGAEGILTPLKIYYDLCAEHLETLDRSKIVEMAMIKFATLHVQRFAEKMVSERLREKYVLTYEELRKVCCDFFRSWWNTPGSNTDQGFDAWALKTGLKK